MKKEKTKVLKEKYAGSFGGKRDEFSAMDLTLKLKRLELLDKISVSGAKEMVRIKGELHKRLIKAVGHDFYPPGYFLPT